MEKAAGEMAAKVGRAKTEYVHVGNRSRAQAGPEDIAIDAHNSSHCAAEWV